MLSIHLYNIKFYSFHGVHEEETKLGGEFELDMTVMFEESVNIISELRESINYSDLYDIAKEQMNTPTALLETVVMRIGEEVHQRYSAVKEITISLKKLHPPIMQIQGSVGVSWNKKY